MVRGGRAIGSLGRLALSCGLALVDFQDFREILLPERSQSDAELIFEIAPLRLVFEIRFPQGLHLKARKQKTRE
jgi:hypothetical protein